MSAKKRDEINRFYANMFPMQNHIYEIDLHGINMQESKMILDEIFIYVKKHKGIKEIHIVVGVGRGSDNGPVLPSFVMNYLKEKDVKGILNNGVIVVKL